MGGSINQKLRWMKILFILFLAFCSCNPLELEDIHPWEKHGTLKVDEESRYIHHQDGTPFLWIGCTAWGMTEWLSREEVDFYLDDRKSKGMNVVQFCLFWGKRVDYPTQFTANAPNFYGHKAFAENNGFPDALQPAVNEGGSVNSPNDYWDHVDYCIEAAKKRGMYAAVLPFWGRRYVNAAYPGQSAPVFTMDNIHQYGKFLGERYAHEPHIIWVNGGDVQADAGGDYLQHYRKFAEGLVYGATNSPALWNEKNKAWDALFMTYHPDGLPMKNSSAWFHYDEWLDFHMIETYVKRDFVVRAVQQDLNLPDPKPTVLAEPHYEGITNNHKAEALHIRRQSYQSFFAGAAGFTYGGGFDEDGNGPLFSPSNNWKPLLNQKGAEQMKHLRKFLEENKWYNWVPVEAITHGKGDGELEKVAVKSDSRILIYFPGKTDARLSGMEVKNIWWFNTESGNLISGSKSSDNIYSLPEGWVDGVLVLSLDE
jgi:hypothetical protein